MFEIPSAVILLTEFLPLSTVGNKRNALLSDVFAKEFSCILRIGYISLINSLEKSPI
jgi:hypothetical protein